MQRNVTKSGKGRGFWNQTIEIDIETKVELSFWTVFPFKLRKTFIFKEKVKKRTDCLTDASKIGWGGCIKIGGRWFYARGYWREEDKYLHITHLELKAVYLVLLSFKDMLEEEQAIDFLIDNKAVCAVLCKGRYFNSMIAEIWSFLRERKISITVRYIRSEHNVVADRLSRMEYTEDYAVTKEIVGDIERVFGKHDIDLFATYENRRCRDFYSLYHSPFSKGINAMLYNWNTHTHTEVNRSVG